MSPHTPACFLTTSVGGSDTAGHFAESSYGEICSIRSTFAPGFSKFAALRGFSGDAGEMEGMMLTCGMKVIEAPTREMPGY